MGRVGVFQEEQLLNARRRRWRIALLVVLFGLASCAARGSAINNSANTNRFMGLFSSFSVCNPVNDDIGVVGLQLDY